MNEEQINVRTNRCVEIPADFERAGEKKTCSFVCLFPVGYLLLNYSENLAGGHWINSWFLNMGIGTVSGFPLGSWISPCFSKDRISINF